VAPPPSTLTRRSVLLSFGASALFVASGVMTGAVLARTLGPEGRGELAMVTLWPEALLLVFGWGLGPTVAYFASSRPLLAGRVYANALLMAAAQWCAVAAVGLAVIPAALGARHAGLVPLGLLYVCLLPLQLLGSVHAGMLQARLRMGRHGVHRMVPTFAYLAGLVALAALGAVTVSAVVYVLLASAALSVVLGVVLVRGLLGGGIGLERGLQREMLRFGAKTQAADLLLNLNLRLGALVLSLQLPAAALGQYAVAVGATGFFVVFGHAVGVVALPDVASHGTAERPARVAVLLRRSLLLITPAALALAAALPWLLPLVYGREFGAAVAPARVLVAAAFLVSVRALLNDALRGMNVPGWPALAELATLAATALALWLALPGGGIMGAAVASAAGSAVGFAVLATWVAAQPGLGLRALLPGPEDVKGVWRSLTA
jgi:O-antigen/teichoic acid export membrane protein